MSRLWHLRVAVTPARRARRPRADTGDDRHDAAHRLPRLAVDAADLRPDRHHNRRAGLIGPPLLGLIADHIGYHRALAFVALPILLAIVLAGQVSDRRGTKRTDLAFGD